MTQGTLGMTKAGVLGMTQGTLGMTTIGDY